MATIETTSPSTQTLEAFVHDTTEQSGDASAFANATPRTLRIDVNGSVWLKPGAAVAYRGHLVFERRQTLAAESLTDAVLRETAPLVRARGQGRLYCGWRGTHLRTIVLRGETLVVSWPDLVAFEESLAFQPFLSGHGLLAIATHGRPLTLPVAPECPVITDPHATIAWSASLSPRLQVDVTWRTAIGHGGHEPFLLSFDGEGFVVVQPYENAGRFTLGEHPLRTVASKIVG